MFHNICFIRSLIINLQVNFDSTADGILVTQQAISPFICVSHLHVNLFPVNIKWHALPCVHLYYHVSPLHVAMRQEVLQMSSILIIFMCGWLRDDVRSLGGFYIWTIWTPISRYIFVSIYILSSIWYYWYKSLQKQVYYISVINDH